MTVNDCINLFYNTLNATNKDGKVYAASLGYTVNTENKIDYLSFVKSQTEGPVIATGEWQSKIPFTAATATYYLDGEKSDYTSINEYDVLYYSKNLKTIWAYDNRITGTVETISPNTISPTSVKVAGTEYTLEGTDVTIAFSSLGNIKESDIVTLLLGKDGTAVGAVKMDNYNTVISGVVLSTGTHLIQNSEGNYENSNYVTFVDAAGNTYDQDYDEGAVAFSQYDLIQVLYQDGKASVSKLTKGTKDFGGYTFSSDGSKLGNVTLASNAKILDHDTNYKSINPVRLANVTISNDQIYYYDLNKNGELSNLILDNVTGDADQYGVLTKISYNTNSGISYEYDLDGKKSSLILSSLVKYNANIGPEGFTYNGGTISGAYALNEISVYSIGKITVQDKDTVYPLADEYEVYYLNDNTYVATTLDKISNLKKYRVKAYYDKLPSFGGRIRIIVAQSID